MLFISHPYFYIDKTPMNWGAPASTPLHSLGGRQIGRRAPTMCVAAWSSWGKVAFGVECEFEKSTKHFVIFYRKILVRLAYQGSIKARRLCELEKCLADPCGKSRPY